ncbi:MULTISPECIES: hypothetical protein [Desulfosporosinus]|uniref:Uncharacterized protein n=1 Tax=Desulfosporosinus acididurans TaxID=476652 RepID=A0A0J1ISR7_9FIRM|nr:MULTISPECIES: hypothetical protein [Desulfosporosinus]KLU67696.1 hypothetical protein DEAC_c01000 [Desulfosporosinus acididurans]
MDEHVEEIKPISSIRPARKIGFADSRKGRRETMYHFDRKNVQKRMEPKASSLKKVPTHNETCANNFASISEEIMDIKKRLPFDRAKIIPEE